MSDVKIIKSLCCFDIFFLSQPSAKALHFAFLVAIGYIILLVLNISLFFSFSHFFTSRNNLNSIIVHSTYLTSTSSLLTSTIIVLFCVPVIYDIFHCYSRLFSVELKICLLCYDFFDLLSSSTIKI